MKHKYKIHFAPGPWGPVCGVGIGRDQFSVPLEISKAFKEVTCKTCRKVVEATE